MDCTLISELQESKVCPTMNICNKKKIERVFANSAPEIEE